MQANNRKIVLDTETTGMPAEDGHRIIEIGCVEMIGRDITGNTYHQYLNPQREVDQGAFEVHGLGDDFLADKPVMAQCIDEFINFIDGAELIIHNAKFDVGFLDYELKLLGHDKRIADICQVTDTLAMARKKYPGSRVSLDALTKKLNIKQFNRELHGALLDSEILAQVYLAMTGGQKGLLFDSTEAEKTAATDSTGTQSNNITLVEVPLNDDEIALHRQALTGKS